MPDSDRRSLARCGMKLTTLVLKETSAELHTATSAHTLDRSPVKSLLDLDGDIPCHNLLYLSHVAALLHAFPLLFWHITAICSVARTRQ